MEGQVRICVFTVRKSVSVRACGIWFCSKFVSQACRHFIPEI